MNEAMTSFLEIVKVCAPFSLFWGLGIKAYKYVTGAILGRDPNI